MKMKDFSNLTDQLLYALLQRYNTLEVMSIPNLVLMDLWVGKEALSRITDALGVLKLDALKEAVK